MANEKKELESREAELSAKFNDYNEKVKKLNESIQKLRAKEETLKKQESEISAREEAISKKEKALTQKEADFIEQAKAKAQEYLYEKKQKIDSEMSQKRTDTLSKIEEECSNLRTQRMAAAENAANKIIQDANERAQREKDASEAEIENLQNKVAALSGENTTLRTDFESKKTELVDLQSNLAHIKEEYENNYKEKVEALEFDKKMLEKDKETLREAQENLDAEMEEKYKDLIAEKDKEIKKAYEIADKRLQENESNLKLIDTYSSMKAQLGENPAELLIQFTNMKKELQEATEKLANYASPVLAKTYADLKKDEEALLQKQEECRKTEQDLANQKSENAKILQERDNLIKEKDELNRHVIFLEEENKRLTASYEDESNREERIRAINVDFVKEVKRMDNPPKSEAEWLNGINQKIKESELYFPKRILNAFHTSLKSAEISPLTVLAGVSGTGKSELPRLYSRFGGINFLSLPVQPNWDSQEAMLGYYNSIDNCFDAQPVLRLLAQTQKDKNENGLDDVMSIILLDEMNLANVELYFSDFLSKLESRRGCSDENVPYLDVKIGSKMEDWKLKLGRNVLWVGTMNEDETTKTLSDKVLDRGIVIKFPSPKTLKSRSSNIILPEESPLLPRTIWNQWLKNAAKFSEEEIKDYKNKVEEINAHLSKTGRALGHRVWQSIETYMSNYPDVISAADDTSKKKAMNIAFEDQIVQKVMPKLRGIEVRGIQGEVLESIKKIIPDTLHADFSNAMEQGYGQFMWTTSSYLNSEELKSSENK